MLGLMLLVLERLLLLQDHFLGFTFHVLHLLFRFHGDYSRPFIGRRVIYSEVLCPALFGRQRGRCRVSGRIVPLSGGGRRSTPTAVALLSRRLLSRTAR